MAFNADVSSLLEQLQLYIYYTATTKGSGQVLVSNFRSIEVRFGGQGAGRPAGAAGARAD